MFMDQQHPFHGPPHAVLLKVLPHTVEPRLHRTILLVHGIFRTESVVRERIQIDHTLAKRHFNTVHCRTRRIALEKGYILSLTLLLREKMAFVRVVTRSPIAVCEFRSSAEVLVHPLK